ncbi:hypothetical protein [Photobacterium kishitanii]|nr:hypothetical protein [Photobacterium kishitanii]
MRNNTSLSDVKLKLHFTDSGCLSGVLIEISHEMSRSNLNYEKH